MFVYLSALHAGQADWFPMFIYPAPLGGLGPQQELITVCCMNEISVTKPVLDHGAPVTTATFSSVYRDDGHRHILKLLCKVVFTHSSMMVDALGLAK